MQVFEKSEHSISVGGDFLCLAKAKTAKKG